MNEYGTIKSLDSNVLRAVYVAKSGAEGLPATRTDKGLNSILVIV
jgi:hypothetical protein